MNDCYYKKITDDGRKSTISEDVADTTDDYVNSITCPVPPKCTIVIDDEDPYKPWDSPAEFDISPDYNVFQDPLIGSSKALFVYRIVNLIYWTCEIGVLVYLTSSGIDSKRNMMQSDFISTCLAT